MTYAGKDGRADGVSAPSGEDFGMGSFGRGRNTSEAEPNAPSLDFRPDELMPFTGTGYEFIPLHGPNDLDRYGRKIGKAPLKGWRTAEPMSATEAQRRLQAGSNVGVRLRPCDLVVDVDPRNFVVDDDPVARLQRDLGFRLDDYPQVVTGSGGFHFYMIKPEGLDTVETLKAYPGIEFKTFGRQVVAPGSIHPDTGKSYRWDEFAEPLRAIGNAPDGLIKLLRKPEPTATNDAGEVSPEQLVTMLEGLDAVSYRDHTRWLEMMMACHHATAGTGRDEFVMWSTSDPQYADRSVEIGRRWDSLHTDRGGRAVTARTLYKALHDARRGDLIPRDSTQDDFPNDLPPVRQDRSAPPKGIADEWVYVIDAEAFVRRADGKKWSKDQWKAAYAHRFDGPIVEAVFKGKLRVRKFESLVYLPGKGEFPDGEDGGRYNIWRDSGIDAKPGDVDVFIDHLANVVPDDVERGYVLDYLAMLVQAPGRKVHYALLVRGGQGTGKSWIGRMMTAIIGAPNVVFPSNDEVLSQWTVWTEGSCLAVIEELMARGRLDMANRLKPIITEPTLRIEEKKRSIYTIPNHLNLIAFTNHEDALPIETGDRRWLVISSEMKPMDEAYYERLFAFLEGDGPAYVKHYLLNRQVQLNPKGMAPSTKGKAEMRRRSLSEAEQYLAELLEGREGPFAFDLVRLEELVACVPADLKRHTRNVRTKVAGWLKDEVGAVKHTRYTKGDDISRPSCQLWSVRNHENWAEAGAAARAEAFQSRYSDEIDS